MRVENGLSVPETDQEKLAVSRWWRDRAADESTTALSRQHARNCRWHWLQQAQDHNTADLKAMDQTMLELGHPDPERPSKLLLRHEIELEIAAAAEDFRKNA